MGACLLDIACMMGVAGLVIIACLVDGMIKNNSPLGACLLDIACLMGLACLVIKACLVDGMI